MTIGSVMIGRDETVPRGDALQLEDHTTDEASFASKMGCDLDTRSGIGTEENQLTLDEIEVEPSSLSE
jgi:hypothetical protein